MAVIGAYDRKAIRATLRSALAEAGQGGYRAIVIRDGACLKKSRPSPQRVKADAGACKKCNLCLICPGLALGADGVPEVTNLCSGCGGHAPACAQMCPTGVLRPVGPQDLGRAAAASFPAAPADLPQPPMAGAPSAPAWRVPFSSKNSRSRCSGPERPGRSVRLRPEKVLSTLKKGWTLRISPLGKRTRDAPRPSR